MEIIIIILVTIILAEVSYLVAVNTKKISHKSEIRPIFVDTSVLIDGRIIAVASSGFVGGVLSIPRSVIGELQFLADNADAEKRSRARHGLDVVSELQNMPGVKVQIFQDGSRAEEGVDERLLMLAKKYQGSICTIDYNLNKVAQVEDIKVLNVNDLAMSLRMAYLPGEKMLLELTQKGQDSHQAVGHLTDGTMVVVEHASDRIGKTVEIEFVRSLQTAAGKMMFAKLVDHKKPQANIKRQSNNIRKPIANQNTQNKNPNVFHSDNNDRRLANKTNNRKRYNKSTKGEQDLINLVNSQN
ncbi:MAG: hypothetical protein WCJ36_01830 [Candidatus Saccharibacteria bacterium]